MAIDLAQCALGWARVGMSRSEKSGRDSCCRSRSLRSSKWKILGQCQSLDRASPSVGLLLVLCGIDQFPESRSIVFNDELPGDLSWAFPVPFIFAVSVEMDGRV